MSAQVLRRDVASFNVAGLSLLDALIRLGQETRTPLGIEYIDREALEKPVTLSLVNITVQRALETLLSAQKGYVFTVRDGVVDISHSGVPAGSRNLFSHVIAEFSAPRCSVQVASNLLRMELIVDLAPSTRGFAGEFDPGNPNMLVGPLKLRAVTVRDVLNRIVATSGKCAWIAQVRPENLDAMPSYGLWTILDYDSAPSQYASVLKETIWGHPQGPVSNKKP
jgi:hypothetical protein